MLDDRSRRKAKKERNKYISAWDKKNRVAVTIRLRRNEDAELIEIYRNIPNKAEWLRNCLMEQKNKMA